jgi:hypothetical protein
MVRKTALPPTDYPQVGVVAGLVGVVVVSSYTKLGVEGKSLEGVVYDVLALQQQWYAAEDQAPEGRG